MIKLTDDIINRADDQIYIGDGWIPIVNQLNEMLKSNAPDYTITQIKSKFGGLRFYAEDYKPEDQEYVDLAERLAYCTCEKCGQYGTLRSGGWLSTLCDDCYNSKTD